MPIPSLCTFAHITHIHEFSLTITITKKESYYIILHCVTSYNTYIILVNGFLK